MNNDGYDLNQDNRSDNWWEKMQQDAYDEAGAAVENRLYGGPVEETKLFAEAERLKTEMAANGAFDSLDQWLGQVDQLPDIAVYLPDEFPTEPLTAGRVPDWEAEARRDLDNLPPLSHNALRTPEVEAAQAGLLFGPEGDHAPALGDTGVEEAALNQMEAEFADLIAQLAAEVDFRAPQMEEPQSHRAPSGPDLDF
jgi:hypothetical protein